MKESNQEAVLKWETDLTSLLHVIIVILVIFCLVSGNPMPLSPTAVLPAKNLCTQLEKAKEKNVAQSPKNLGVDQREGSPIGRTV